MRFNCLDLYAERTRNPEVCERLDGEDEQARTLRDFCIAGVAVARHEPALCERPRDMRARDSCYMMLVVERPADRALCARISNLTAREACVENADSSE